MLRSSEKPLRYITATVFYLFILAENSHFSSRRIFVLGDAFTTLSPGSEPGNSRATSGTKIIVPVDLMRLKDENFRNTFSGDASEIDPDTYMLAFTLSGNDRNELLNYGKEIELSLPGALNILPKKPSHTLI